MLDLGPTFSPEAEHLDRLLDDRDQVNAGRVPLGVSFLDDVFGGVYPRDLLLLAAGTGVGKTALAVQAALAGVKAGKDVYFFALEAEVGEVSARLFFSELGKRVQDPALDFSAWWRGDQADTGRMYEAEIKKAIRPQLARLQTLYKKRGDFTPKNLSQQLEAVASKAGLVVLDHVHVIDGDDKRSENETQKQVVRLLRDMSIGGGVPVVCASHLRKKQAGEQRSLLPDIHELHGSSEISKVATHVAVFARDWESQQPRTHLSPTLMQVLKDRAGRQGPLVARVQYDMSKGLYEAAYELGRIEWQDRKQKWQPVPVQFVPSWATREATRLAGAQSIL